jgi:hypothetical protein
VVAPTPAPVVAPIPAPVVAPTPAPVIPVVAPVFAPAPVISDIAASSEPLEAPLLTETAEEEADAAPEPEPIVVEQLQQELAVPEEFVDEEEEDESDSLSKWVKVCDEATGICRLVQEKDAPIDVPGCELREIHVIDEETGAPVLELAYVCNLSETNSEDGEADILDFTSAPVKDPLAPAVRHPEDAREVEEVEEVDPEFFTVCDAETGTCQLLPFNELPQTCELKQIEVEDEDGNMIVKTVLLCEADDLALQDEIDSYKGDPEARSKTYEDVINLSLCTDLASCQRLVWDLSQEKQELISYVEELELQLEEFAMVFEEAGGEFEEVFEEATDDVMDALEDEFMGEVED